MLASALPGIRHLRAPLVAGYIVLAAVFIFASRYYESSAEVSDDWPGGEKLFSFLGAAAPFAVISFGAYLVGSVVVSVTRVVLSWRSRRRGRYTRQGAIWGEGFLDEYSYPEVGELSRQLFEQWESLSTPGKDRAFAVLAAARVTGTESSDRGVPSNPDLFFNYLEGQLLNRKMAEQLLVKSGRLYDEYDRRLAEAEMRESLLLPVLLLLAVGAIDSTWPWWALALTGAGVLLFLRALFVQALNLRRSATRVLANALRDGLVETPLQMTIREAAS